MYHVSAQGVDERIINVHYYYYYYLICCCGEELILPSCMSQLSFGPGFEAVLGGLQHIYSRSIHEGWR